MEGVWCSCCEWIRPGYVGGKVGYGRRKRVLVTRRDESPRPSEAYISNGKDDSSLPFFIYEGAESNFIKR